MAFGNFFMPGEVGGVPQTNRVDSLLGNPYLQMGLGILANNQGNYGALAPALGRGALLGMQNAQQFRAFQQQQKQQEMENKLREAQMREMERKQQEEARNNAAFDELAKKYNVDPALVRLDPKGFVKSVNPQMSEADPYFSPVYDATRGLGAFNARTGSVKWEGGNPIVKPSDDPELQRRIAAAKAAGEGQFKLNDMIPGRVDTVTNISNEINGVPQRKPTNFPKVSPQEQSARDQKRMQILLAEQQAYGGAGANPALDAEISQMRGIRVPTKAEEAAAKAQAEANIELDMKPRIKAAELSAESAAKRDSNMGGIGSIIDEARNVLTGKTKPTSSAAGSVVDALGGAVGISVSGAAEADQLKSIGGALVAKMPRMEGPQSNFDVQNYQRMAGDVGNEKLPIERRLKALDTVEKLWRKYDKSSNQPQKTRSRADILKQYGVK